MFGKRTACKKLLINTEERLEELNGRLGPEARRYTVRTCSSRGMVVGDGEEVGEGEMPFGLMG